MINRDKVTEMLKNYASYRYAVRMYESPRTTGASTADYSGMPKGGGFGSRTPSRNDGISFQDTLDYLEYKDAVRDIEGALDTLTEDEQAVMRHKWINDMTLKQISERKGMSVDTVKRLHKRGLSKMTIALRFAPVPAIILLAVRTEMPKACAF